MESNIASTKFSWQDLPRPFTVLSPMIDVTDTCFRRLVKAWAGPDVLYSEFVSADTWEREGDGAVQQHLTFHPDEQPLIAQLWGLQPENYFKVVKHLIERGFAGVDINMGCSIPNVIRKGSCATLIKQRSLAREIILATQEATQGQVPVSIKTRLGFDRIETEEWASFLLGFKPAALIMHGRVAQEQMRLPANWDEIAKVVCLRDALSPATVVVGNGDVTNYPEIEEKHARYGVDGVMVGRGVLDNPFLFRSDGFSIDQMSGRERLGLLEEHLGLFVATWGRKKRFSVMKKYFKIYLSNFPGASETCARMLHTISIREAREVLRELLAE